MLIFGLDNNIYVWLLHFDVSDDTSEYNATNDNHHASFGGYNDTRRVTTSLTSIIYNESTSRIPPLSTECSIWLLYDYSIDSSNHQFDSEK